MIQVVGLFFGFILFSIAVQGLALFFRKELLFRVAAGVTFLVMFPLFVGGSLLMVLLMPLADLCMDPNGNLAKLFSGETAQAVSYYATCTGENPFQIYIDNIQTASNNALNALSLLTSSSVTSQECSSLLVSNYTSISNDTTALTDLASCNYPHQIYTSAVLRGVCSNGFSGVYSIWLVTFLVAAFLFAILCLANLIYGHYGLYLEENAAKEQVPEEGCDDEEQRSGGTKEYELVPYDSQDSLHVDAVNVLRNKELELVTSEPVAL